MTLPMPNHIAFIMDGNGRWAKSLGFDRIRGHERGAKTLREITRYCRRHGVAEITFYALSTENYRARPRTEVKYLMTLLRDYLVGERNELRQQNIRLCSIGRVEELPKNVLRELRLSEELSRDNDGMTLRLALNYGSRSEILDALAKIGAEIRDGQLDPASLIGMPEESFARYLYDPGMRDPDLLIRTAGEMRVSNFLLWQISYTELWVTDAKWPEFGVEHLEEAIRSYRSRERRFGAVPANANSTRTSDEDASR
ncbi:MAG: di-trans,poly-cis-decaprenylcistransferase [Planctomycetes bacterium]|nr:di-trans,poly-cis-decaprenylcistransferase [Planctomycetota bacterium]